MNISHLQRFTLSKNKSFNISAGTLPVNSLSPEKLYEKVNNNQHGEKNPPSIISRHTCLQGAIDKGYLLRSKNFRSEMSPMWVEMEPSYPPPSIHSFVHCGVKKKRIIHKVNHTLQMIDTHMQFCSS